MSGNDPTIVTTSATETGLNSRSSQPGGAAVNSGGVHHPSPHGRQQLCRRSSGGGRRDRPQRQAFDRNPVSGQTAATDDEADVDQIQYDCRKGTTGVIAFKEIAR